MNLMVVIDGEPKGPMSLEQLKAEMNAGNVNLASLAWVPGSNEWVPLSSLPAVVTLLLPPLPKVDLNKPLVDPPSTPTFNPTIGVFEALVKFVFLPCFGAFMIIGTVALIYFITEKSTARNWIGAGACVYILLTKSGEMVREWNQSKDRLLSIFRSPR